MLVMRVLQINTSVNYGSTGRIAEDIGQLLLKEGHESVIAYGRSANKSKSNIIKIGKRIDLFFHLALTLLFDRHGFGSNTATKLFVKQLKDNKPDLIHLHNIHGYYLNIHVLFEFIKEFKIPIVWTFHDCWPFTGHCSYFDAVNCYKWQQQCKKCPNLRAYPKSWFFDNSKINYNQKKSLFADIENLTIITPSVWLAKHVEESFFKGCRVKVIYNGIDLDVFKPQDHSNIYKKFNIPEGKMILGVASKWDKRKGLSDFKRLRSVLPAEVIIVLVGLSEKQLSALPKGIIGIIRTDNIAEMALLYNCASVFVNPTYVDNFPTTNIEALACGTPVVTYNTGGCSESVDNATGFVVKRGDLSELITAINTALLNGKDHYKTACRNRAIRLFNKIHRYRDYIDIYHGIMNIRHK